MNNDALWAVLLMLAALLIIAVEFFIPSGGLLAVCALAALVASLVLGFKAGTVWGLSMLGTALFGVPFTIWGMLQLLPYTPIGRRFLSQPPAIPPSERTREQESLVGKLGKATTDLLPSGEVLIEGQKYEAVAPGIAINRGSAVEVLRVSGNVIYVGPTERVPPPAIDATESWRELGLEELDKPLG